MLVIFTPAMKTEINRALIRQRIRDLGFTQAGAAKRAQMSVHTLRAMLSREWYGEPGAFVKQRLAEVLEVPEAKIFPSVGADGGIAS